MFLTMEGVYDPMTAISSAVTNTVGWVGEIITALFSETGSWAGIFDFYVIGIGLSICAFAAVMIGRLVWGR